MPARVKGPTDHVVIVGAGYAGLSAALRLHTINVVGEANNLAVAENLFRSLQPEVLIIDIQFDGQEAISLVKKLRKLNPAL